jgi:SM-20-related protein
LCDIALDPSEFLLDEIADALVAKGYVVVDNCLPDRILAGLIFHFSSLSDTDFKQAGVGRQDDFQLNRNVRRDRIHWLQNDVPAETVFLSWMDVLRQGLNRRLFLGLVDYECHYASYGVGAFYKKHYDAFKAPPAILQTPVQVSPIQAQPERVLSSVIYLNQDWQLGDGGELLLYDSSDNFLENIAPVYGKLVLFLSEKFPHEVAVAQRERHSIAGWFRVNATL